VTMRKWVLGVAGNKRRVTGEMIVQFDLDENDSRISLFHGHSGVDHESVHDLGHESDLDRFRF
jgi:hypothetical protein